MSGDNIQSRDHDFEVKSNSFAIFIIFFLLYLFSIF